MDTCRITVMVPALNEEGCIAQTLDDVRSALDASGMSGEILAIDDGSTDTTLAIMRTAAEADPRIRPIHHDRPMGLGHDYWEAIQQARGEYLVLIPGDAEITGGSITRLFSYAGQADIVSCYSVNPIVRGWKRRFVSRAYVMLVNLLYGYGLRYYNGPCMVRVALLKTLRKPTASFAYMTEIIVQLLDRGATVHEIEMTLRQRKSGKTKAFAFKNVVGVIRTLAWMYKDLRMTRRIPVP